MKGPFDGDEVNTAFVEYIKNDSIAFHAKLTDKQKGALAQLILDHGKKGWHGGR
ncbi:hypothetical protein [Maridesulfovibrio sp.]|uniref:hypothetical protein n=1 Tax=Maridesulfovibrio sp. TaxID=2795000 RepID=UPI002AA77679|nr:hypothetical protein [Maridesulfovibrio sp.]